MSDGATARPLWRRLIGFNLLSRRRPRDRRLLRRLVARPPDPRRKPRLLRRHEPERHRADARLPVRRDRFPGRPRLRPLPARAGCSAASAPSSRTRRGASAATSALCTDHKVVGIQYLFGIGLFFFIAGLNAMLIRAELLRPSPQLFDAGNYLTLVGLHGTMMMGIMTSGILGPFANYFVPLMIGARRMAFPRIESLTFWLLMAAGVILVSTIFFGGFPTGWTGYAPLNDQANYGFDSYIFFFALVGVSMTLLGLNLIATIVDHARAGADLEPPADLLLGRPDTSVLMVLAAPVLIAALLMVALRPRRRRPRSSSPAPAAAPTCSRTSSGSSATRRSTSSPCPASGSCSRSCRSSPASRCGATGSPSRGCSASCCSASSSGSTISSSAVSTRRCGPSTCSPRS